MESAQILQELETRLRSARAWRERASAHFDAVTGVIPGRRPDPKNIEEIKVAADQYGRALLELESAITAHNEFVLYGKLPPDIERKLPGCERAMLLERKAG